MNFTPKFVASFFLLVVAACSSVTVSTNYDPDVDFSRGFHSYAWQPDFDPNTTGAADSLTDKLLREAIDAEMVAKGLVPSDSAPDFFVTYQVTVERQFESGPSSGVGFGVGSGGGFGVGVGVSSHNDVYVRDEGTLILDFLAPGTHALLWRGKASRSVTMGDSRDEMMSKARDAVKRMLDRFPPKKS